MDADWETKAEEGRGRLRRVISEDRQRKTLEQVRDSLGYSPDVDANAHDQPTFRLINQRMQLDQLPQADYVVPALDDWEHWTAMGDWDSRDRILVELIGKLRRREASRGEVTFLVTVCRPTWAAVAANLRNFGGVDVDPVLKESVRARRPGESTSSIAPSSTR